MNILVDGRLLSEKSTGISRYSEEIIKIYQKKFGFNNVYVLVNEISEEKKIKFRWIKIKYKPFNISDFFFFSFFLKKLNFQVYHSLFYSNSFFKVKNKVYILTIHDLMYGIVKDFFGKSKIKNFIGIKYYNFIVGKSIKNSDYIISISDTTKNDVKKFFLKDSVIIPQGLNRIKGEKKVVPILKSERYLLYVGNSRPHKNLEFLISTYKKSNLVYKLVIAGTKNSFVSNNKNIISLGFVQDEELNWLYENCAAFIFPSKYEGFGMPILEALDKGAKVMSSTGGALKEFSEKAIFYFDPYDEKELLSLLQNIEDIFKEKSEIKKEIEKYSWKNTEKILSDYLDKWL